MERADYLSEPVMAHDSEEYVRPRIDYLRENEINIRFLSIGCLVRVGCREIAFNSLDEAVKEINDYINNPKEVTKKYYQLFNNQK